MYSIHVFVSQTPEQRIVYRGLFRHAGSNPALDTKKRKKDLHTNTNF